MMMRIAFGVLVSLAVMRVSVNAMGVAQLRQMSAKNNMTCIFVFGDSSVDPGNNNRIDTVNKANFPPYGKNFVDGIPTGRFSNGKLPTDFIAEVLGYEKVIRGFLDPNLKKEDLLHGVSFASAGSGYDDLTANLSVVFSVSQQLKYMRHYQIHLKQYVGEKKANEIIKNAIFLLSMSTNDFLQNYFIEPDRAQHFTVEAYENFLISCMDRDIKEMHKIGARRLVVVGAPPFGCFPLMRTIRDAPNCDKDLNQVALSFNSKIQEKLDSLKMSLGIKTAYLDIYHVILNAIQNPHKFGFTETGKGCCGTGTIEYGETCKGMDTCANPEKYVYWDAVHPTEAMYKIIADTALDSRRDMYEGASTSVRTAVGRTEELPIKIGVHQGSALSPFLFAIVMDVLTGSIQDEVPWCLMFADDIVLIDESREGVERKLELWRNTLETRGFRLSRSKTEYLECNFSGNGNRDGGMITFDGNEIKGSDFFRYLGSIIQKDGELDSDVAHRIKAGWVKWKNATGFLCDRGMPHKLKGKFYRTAVRPALLYGTECWAVKQCHVQKMNVAEMRMLRWMCGHTRKDRLRNEVIREKVRVAPIEDKMVENRLRWFGHVRRRPTQATVRRLEEWGKEKIGRGRGRPKQTWLKVIENDMRCLGITTDMARERAIWKERIRVDEAI